MAFHLSGGDGVAMEWQIYRPREGRWARTGAMLTILGMGTFSAYRWYNWATEEKWLPFVGQLPPIGQHQLNWGEIGAAALVILFSLFAYRLCFVRTKSCDFLIETEIELKKVTWPKWKPLSLNTELWGSTFVVIVVVAALAFFIYCVDWVLLRASNWAFLS